MHTARYWIRKLGLLPHPEGGCYRETYRSSRLISRAAPGGRGRACSTAIYFLLERPDFSAFHRLRSDEIWHFHEGGALRIHMLRPDGGCEKRTLGTSRAAGAAPQVVISAGTWFAAEISGGADYALLSCTVAPGFEFADFELGARAALCGQFPRHRRLIARLTRG